MFKYNELYFFTLCLSICTLVSHCFSLFVVISTAVISVFLSSIVSPSLNSRSLWSLPTSRASKAALLTVFGASVSPSNLVLSLSPSLSIHFSLLCFFSRWGVSGERDQPSSSGEGHIGQRGPFVGQLLQQQLRQACDQVADKEGRRETHHRCAVHRNGHHREPEARVPQPYIGVWEWVSPAAQLAAVGRGRVRSGDLHHWRHLHGRVLHRAHRGWYAESCSVSLMFEHVWANQSRTMKMKENQQTLKTIQSCPREDYCINGVKFCFHFSFCSFCHLPQSQCPDLTSRWWPRPSWSTASTLTCTAPTMMAQSPSTVGWRGARCWPMTRVCCFHLTKRCWPSPVCWRQTTTYTPAQWRTPSAPWRACLWSSPSTVGGTSHQVNFLHVAHLEQLSIINISKMFFKYKVCIMQNYYISCSIIIIHPSTMPFMLYFNVAAGGNGSNVVFFTC